MQRNGDTGDVPDADGRRESGRKSLEVRYVARLVRVVVSAGGHGEAVPEMTELNEPKAKREVDASTDQDDHNKRDGLRPDSDPKLEDPVL
jgi:hypothetical protein